MRTTQSKFLDAVNKAANDYKREAIVNFEFANVGRVIVYKDEDGLEPLFGFRFEFQMTGGADYGGTAKFDKLPGTRTEQQWRTGTDETFTFDRLPVALTRIQDELARLEALDNQAWWESANQAHSPGQMVKDVWNSLAPAEESGN